MPNKKIVISLLFGLMYMGCEGPAGADGAGTYLTVSPALASVAAGATIDIAVSTKNGEDNDYTWSSSDTDVATVSNGTVTGVSEGTAFVSVVGQSSGANSNVIISVTPSTRNDYSFALDISPMFTSDNFWFPQSDACTWCHYANNEEELGSKHVMNLGTYEGVMRGADPDPDDFTGGMPLFGESTTGATDYDWDSAMLKSRLRNNRMPQAPAWEFRRDESNRLGPDIEFVDGRASIIRPIQYTNWDTDPEVPSALGLIEAWVGALSSVPVLADSNNTFSYGGQDGLTYSDDVQQLFTEGNMWFEGSTPCVECHFANIEESFHVMDLSSFTGMIRGADYNVDDGTGMSLFSDGMTTDMKMWGMSRIKKRLRDNRMPPNSPFLLSEENRDGPDVWDPVNGEIVTAVDLIGLWLEAGAPQ